MAVTTIDLTDQSSWPQHRDHRAVKVWTKTVWNSPWVLNNNFLLQEAVWAIAPSFSRASLQYRYGPAVAMPGENLTRVIPKLTTRGYYVLIKIETDDAVTEHTFAGPQSSVSSLFWLGYADSPVVTERFSQSASHGESGVQDVPCWGFDRALMFSRVQTTVHSDPSGGTFPWRRAEGGSVFNDGIKGNRTETKVDLYDSGSDTIEGHVFENPNVEEREWWSTRDIFEHLARMHLPTSNFTPGNIPWTVDTYTMLPNWDRPRIDTDGRSAWDILNDLLSPDRYLGWKVDFTLTPDTPFDPPVVHKIVIQPFTRAESSVTLPSIGNLPANPDQFVLADLGDPLSDGQLQLDDSDSVDQVIVRGPREIGVATWRFGEEWVSGWTTPERTEYTNTYTAHPLWQDRKDHEKKEFNQYFRNKPKFDDVYRHFPIKVTWDGTTEGGHVFRQINDQIYIPYLGNAFLMEDLPLFSRVDYKGATDQVDESLGQFRLPILVFFEKPDDPAFYIAVQNANTLYGGPPVKRPNSLPYGVAIKANNDRGPAFQVEVSGAPRHAISKAFTGNEADVERTNPGIWGGYSYRDMLITAAMVCDRRPEHRIPDVVSGLDVVRRRVIDLEHPGLEMVHIAAETVVDLDLTGLPLTSDGGLLRDPSKELEALATLAAKSLVDARKQLSWRSARILGSMKPGYMIKTYNGESANVMIRELRVTTPVTIDDSPPPIQMHIDAATNEVDIVSLVGRVPEPEAV